LLDDLLVSNRPASGVSRARPDLTIPRIVSLACDAPEAFHRFPNRARVDNFVPALRVTSVPSGHPSASATAPGSFALTSPEDFRPK